MLKQLGMILMIAAMVAGCAPMMPQYHVSIDAINSDLAPGGAYYRLYPGNKDTKEGDLQYQEFARYVARALADSGFIPAQDFERADIAIYLSYGIGDPQTHEYAFLVPAWGMHGMIMGSYNDFYPYGFMGHHRYHGRHHYDPYYSGYVTETASYTSYARFLTLDAYDLNSYRNAGKKDVEIWKTSVTSRGTSEDLRRVMPILVAAAKPYLGLDTGHQLHQIYYADDPAVYYIKGLTTPPSAHPGATPGTTVR